MRRTILFLLTLALFADSARAQQEFPLTAAQWSINPGLSSQAAPFDLFPGIAFNFPKSPLSDPNATPPWYGYLLLPWTQSISGSSLNATLTVLTKKNSPVFNFMSDSGNTCTNPPASVRLYFQTGGLYNGDNNGTTRWWANPIAAQLPSELDAGQFTLSVSLDPSQWSDTFGAQGNSSQEATTGFYNTLANPTYVGMTFGGGCFFGHGVNTSFGKAQFQVLAFYTL